MKQKTILGAILIIIVLLLIGSFAAWKLHARTHLVVVPTHAGWKVYQDNTDGLSFEYPSSFEAEKTNYNGYSVTRVYDPNTKANYLSVMEWDTPPSDSDNLFVGPYPREDSSSMVVEKTLNGMQGVEVYGYISEGHGYNDSFMYKNTHLWAVSYDPVLDGRITEYPEPGTPTPDKDTYEQIIASIKISS